MRPRTPTSARSSRCRSLGRGVDDLERQLEADEKKKRRDRLSLLRIYEDLAALGYEGGYDAVRRYARAWRRRRLLSAPIPRTAPRRGPERWRAWCAARCVAAGPRGPRSGNARPPLGMRVSGYLVACALHEDAGGPRRDEPRLVLSEEQQRTLYERVEEMDRVRRALGESLPGSKLSVIGAIAFMQRAVQSRREDK